MAQMSVLTYRSHNNGENPSTETKPTHIRPPWSGVPLVSSPPSAPGPMEIETLPRSPGGSQSDKRSMPLVTYLLETSIDKVPRIPVPIVTTEEVGPSAAHSTTSTVTEEPLLLTEALTWLKQLKIENTPVPAPARNNVNLNMNNQEEVVKLREKSLNSVGSSPVLNHLKAPEELKSNILKAQAEAALKNTKDELGLTVDKNCNLQEAAASLEANVDEFISSAPPLSPDPVNETQSPKVSVLDPEPLTDNLIDSTDPIPVVPAPKPTITPRWIIPASALTQSGTFTNGLLDCAAKMPSHHPEGGTISPFPHVTHTHNVIASSIVSHPTKEDNHKPKGLLTTEL